jgi:hypothetical protein
MKIKKVLIFVLFAFTILLAGCGADSTPEKLWNRFVKIMNSKDIEAVAEVYYEKGSSKYKNFIENNDPIEYFNFDTIKTKEFVTLIANDRYYQAEVTLTVDNSYENIFEVYFVKDPNTPWRFISEVSVNAFELENLGNKPDSGYYNSIIKDDGQFQYKYVYGGVPGVAGANDYIKIVHPNKNARKIVIPDEIEGAPVTFIGDKAFFDFFKIFSTVTFSKSKLEEIVLPNQLKIIDKEAFYQAKKLKSIDLPATVEEVRNYAFASSGLEKIVINVDDEAAYASLAIKEGLDIMTINGEKVVYMGDNIPAYTTTGAAPVNWSVSDPEVASITNIGKLTALKTGTVDIIATSTVDSSYFSKATIEIRPKEEKMVASSIPAAPFQNFKFDINRIFFTGEEFSTNMSLVPIWTTSDPKVAVVEGTKIKMVGAGTVTITATARDNATVKASATIEVKDISEKSVQTVYSYETFKFTNARDMFKGDYIKLNAEGFAEGEIEWTSDSTTVATVGRYSGVVTAVGTGTTVIRAKRIDNPNIISSVIIEVKTPVKGVTFLENSLDRLHKLKEIYIYSINPNSVTFNGTLKLPADVKIYVPAQNIESYKTKKEFSSYQKNIFPMPE